MIDIDSLGDPTPEQPTPASTQTLNPLPPPTFTPGLQPSPSNTPRRPGRRLLARTVDMKYPLLTIAAVAVVWGVFADVPRYSTVGALVVFGATALVAAWSMSRSFSQITIAVAAVAFLPWLAVRASPWLIELDVLAFFAVVVHALSSRRTITRHSLGGYLTQWFDAALAAFIGPVYVWRELRRQHSVTLSRRHRVGAAARAAVVPAIIGVVVLAILASGDALFASYFNLDLSISTRFIDGIGYAVVGVIVLIGGAGVAARPATNDPASNDPALGSPRVSLAPHTVWLTLITLAVTIGAFGAAQLSGALLGESYVTRRTGLSYATWARQGFFQLVVVAAIAAVALGAASVAAADHPRLRRRIGWASTFVSAAIIALVVSSYIKLSVYTDQYGLTMLRFYTMTFSIWLGVIAIVLLVAVWRAGGTWVATAVLASALVGAFTMNVINPEHVVVSHNLDRVIAGEIAPEEFTPRDPVVTYDDRNDPYSDRFDADYVSDLSADGLSVAFERLGDLPAELREVAVARWCGIEIGETAGIDYNASVRAAAAAQLEHCGSSGRASVTD